MENMPYEIDSMCFEIFKLILDYLMNLRAPRGHCKLFILIGLNSTRKLKLIISYVDVGYIFEYI